jgi:hypothetical protein
MNHPTDPTNLHTNHLPSQAGVDAASTTSDAYGSRHPQFVESAFAETAEGCNSLSDQRDRTDHRPTNSDGSGSAPLPVTPFPCGAVFRDALKDLVSHDGMTSINPENAKCPWGIALQKNGLVRWSTISGPGKWAITNKGWAFLETRVIHPKETR